MAAILSQQILLGKMRAGQSRPGASLQPAHDHTECLAMQGADPCLLHSAMSAMLLMSCWGEEAQLRLAASRFDHHHLVASFHSGHLRADNEIWNAAAWGAMSSRVFSVATLRSQLCRP